MLPKSEVGHEPQPQPRSAGEVRSYEYILVPMVQPRETRNNALDRTILCQKMNHVGSAILLMNI